MNTIGVRTQPWAFISNMFPSAGDISYGAFVQRNLEDLLALGFRIDIKVLIRGRHSGSQRLMAYITHYMRLAKLLAQPSVHHWYMHYASHHCLLPALGAYLQNKQIVVNIHGDDLALSRASFYRRIMSIGQSLLLHRARLIVVPSLYFKELTLHLYPKIAAERIVVSPSGGIDYLNLCAATAMRNPFWAQKHSSRIAEIGYIGRIDADKGWEALFDAFDELPGSVRDRARLYFWGEGQDSPQLRARIAARGDERVVYYGAIHHSELPSAHAQFDFQVVPSHRESLGLAALEGMGAGHVLICRAIRPFTDMTKHGISALHFGSNRNQDLGRVLRAALQQTDQMLAAIATEGRLIAGAFDRRAVATELAHQIDSHLLE